MSSSSVASPTEQPKQRRKLSTVQLSAKIQLELANPQCSKSGKTRLSSAWRQVKSKNEVTLSKGSIAYKIAQAIQELEKAHRMETERNMAETVYEIIRLANDISDIAASKIIKNCRNRPLKQGDLPDAALKEAPEAQVASVHKLMRILSFYGILNDDPRLCATVERQLQIEEQLEEQELPSNPFSKEDFIQCVHPATELISRAFRNELQIPLWRDFTTKIKEVFEETKQCPAEGSVASYIPQLARQNPKWFGMSMCTTDGSRLHLGDSKVPFCLQSVSKAFNYVTVSTDIGGDSIHNYVGHEPSGRLFNEIVLDNHKRPHNPMINAGAIVVSSMIKTDWPMAERFDFIIEQYRLLAGTYPVEFNNATFLSERDTADRNYALSYYMKENKCFPHWEIMNLREELELYFQLCSLECNCETLSVMAATLANGGINPLTYIRVVAPEACRDALSLMYSCGMYDLSGRFSFQVGLPAKSGVSGAMMIVIPDVLGMCTFSPCLDRTGNSTRGVAFCRNFVKYFSFHTYDHKKNDTSEIKKVDPRKVERVNDREVIVSLLYGVKKNNLDLIHRYYMKGFDLEISDYDGRTALHVAAAEGHYDITKFLLSTVGVQHDPRDRWHRTPLDDAITFGHLRLERVLRKYERMELIALDAYSGSDMSDISDFSDSEEDNDNRSRTSTLRGSDAEDTASIITTIEKIPSIVLQPPIPEEDERTEEEKKKSMEEKKQFHSASQLDQMLPPIIRKPSTHGFRRVFT